MKKSLFFYAAATALMLTACTSENDILQTGQTKKVAPQEVGFDVYTQSATDVTRAGFNEGTMNTSRMQFSDVGFGVYAFYSDQTSVADYAALVAGTNKHKPNFMVNEHVTWNGSGWQYSPLKYWPNETNNDSQKNPEAAYMTSRLDRLTFFAYAPYVATAVVDEPGITAITNNKGYLATSATADGVNTKDIETSIRYKAAFTHNTTSDPTKGVDLLWGVAPAGGLTYTAVNGVSQLTLEGKPYIDKAKPDVNTSIKFLFEHALARFGLTVAAAFDQVPQGGELDASTKITVDQVKITGYFGEEGILNLNNPNAHIANWTTLNTNTLAADTKVTDLTEKILIIPNAQLNDQVRDGAGNTVTTAKQDLLKARYSKVDDPTKFVVGDKYWNSDGSTELYANITGDYYILEGSTYKKVINSKGYPAAGGYCTITPGSAVTANVTGTHDPIYKKNGNDYILVCAANVNFTYNPSFDYCYLTATPVTTSVIAEKFTWPDVDYYKPERSYYMVIPTNNLPNICTTGITKDDDLEALRTITVEITYFVTTTDSKLDGGQSRVQNVIAKKVVLPSLDNGKSYNLHLLLGMTSVKVDAEVGDWKEVYVQTDLPQNTPGE